VGITAAHKVKGATLIFCWCRLLDVEAIRRKYRDIQTRVNQSHIRKAYELYELAERVKARESKRSGIKSSPLELEDDFKAASEILDDSLDNVHDRSKPFHHTGTFDRVRLFFFFNKYFLKI
jgi:hypothetical protein